LPSGLTFNTSTGKISGSIANNTSLVQTQTIYTITATNAVGSSTTTISIAIVKPDYWTGKTNTDWNTASNWSTGNVPTSTDYASIGEQKYIGAKAEPTISSGQSVTVGYLALGSTHTPTLTVTGSLTVNNELDVDDNATPILTGTGNVNIIPTAVVTVTGTGSLTINSGLTLTLQSNATSSASINEITNGSIIGNVSVQRYMSAERGYRLMASPVNANSGVTDANGNLPFSLNYLKTYCYLTGTTAAAGGFDKGSNPTLYLYREDVAVNNSSFITGNYRGINNINSAPTYSLDNESSTYSIPASNGYLFYYRGSRNQMSLGAATTAGATATNDTLTTTGYLNQGQIKFRDWYNASSTAPGMSNSNVAVQGFNLVGNPYACTIDLETYNTTTTTSGIYASNLDTYIYELNPANGIYSTYQVGTGAYTNNGSRYIVSGQGFFVHAIGTGGQLIFNETAKAPLKQLTSPNLFMSTKAKNLAANTPAKSLQLLRLEMAQDTLNRDNILVIFDSNAKPGYVLNEDALYRVGAGKVTLSSISQDNQFLSINRLPLNDGTTIPLKVGSNAYSTYTLNLKGTQGIPQIYDIWLKDAFTGDSVNMRTTASYKFSITTDAGSYGVKRFSIVMRENPAMAYQLLTFTASKINNSSETQLNWTTKNEENYTNFTLERSTDGEVTFDVIDGLSGSGTGAYGFVDKAPAVGANYYRLKQEDINGTITYSKVIQVMYTNTNNATVASSLVTFPNPVKNTLNLVIKPKTAPAANKAAYELKISNSSGIVVKYAVLTEANWQGNVSSFLTGSYLIQVTDRNDNSIVGQAKFVKL
jgi:hypothetical protein